MELNLGDYKTDVHNDWCPGCVLPDTLIHCNPSVKQIQQVSVGERVLGRDGFYHKVSEVMAHIHRGKVFKIMTKFFGPTYLTDEHPVLIVRREHPKLRNKNFDAIWTRADQIKEKDYLVYPIQKEELDREYIQVDYKLKDTLSKLSDKIPLNDDVLRMFGYYIAEGYVHGRSVCFTFNSRELEFLNDVENTMLHVFGLRGTRKTKRNATTIAFHCAPLGRVFLEWFGQKALDKKIPHFAMLLPAEKQKSLIKGVWRGDGWISTKQLRGNFKTVSKTLSEQLKTLLLRQGVVPTVSVNKKYGIHKESYSIQVVNDRDFAILCKVIDEKLEQKLHTGKPTSSIITPDYMLIPVRKIESFDYDGPVYNLEVDDVNSYVSENAILHNCGDFGIVNAIQMSLSEMQIPRHKAAIFSGIGCSGKTSHFINVYGVHTLHGRVLTFAQGAKLANPDMEIIAVGGDGDGLGIGAGHFVAAGRRNLDMTYIIFNNGVYGLTKGQASPTLKLGEKTKSLPTPNTNYNVNPIGLAIASGFTFVARGYAYDVRHLKDLIVAAVQHKGLAFLDVLQPCPTYNDINTRDWYAGMDRVDEMTKKPQPRTYHLEDTGYDPVVHYGSETELNEKLAQALIKSLEWDTKIPTGIFYKNEVISQYDKRIMDKIPNYLENYPAIQTISANGRPTTDISPILDSLSI
ncbi:Pyruvate ferredoxin/flavodoxin oxidoreductase, beta subunit [Candidatus Nitrosotenuis uzonensis]|uniref:Pyruvate ferredoxin/flavodoxin oxidoreductase, beta subunit n=1 Tax=Candidatus Nitrosotenuis uzonensis TaxID=1407055 RepID=A0A812F1P8_9ARCH|nr:Pyruvate ferredoxin/flavodoxin oxidoreductase, beta subunit [Candidatus Nitrosotenuis uzonensis]